MSCSTCFSKFGLTIINLLFLAAGASLIVVGSLMCREYTHYSSFHSLGNAMIPAIIVIAVGILAIFLGLFGCVATCKRNKCLHGTYFTVLMIMLVAVIVGVILSLVYRNNIDDGMHEVMMKSMDRYFTDESVKAQVDLAQHRLQCCGVNNASDWLNTEWYKNHSESAPREKYPESCCEKEKCQYADHDKFLNGKGCYIKMRDNFMQYFACIAAAIGGFALILVIGMVLNCVLVMQKRRTYVPYVGLESDQHQGGMRI